jgi:hypothetical protein
MNCGRPLRSCYQPFSAEFHNGAFREQTLALHSRWNLGPIAADFNYAW